MTNWTIHYDMATGQRVFRSAVARARAGALAWLAWLAEIAGVALLAVAAWMIVPALALVIIGAYFVVLANAADTEGK